MIVFKSSLSRLIMQNLYACYSGSLVRMELASLSRVVTMVSAEGIAGTSLDMSKSTQASLQAVRVVFDLSQYTAHNHRLFIGSS